MMNALIQVALVLMWTCAVPATIFPIRYHLRSRWRETKQGCALMLMSIAVALLIDLTLIFHYASPGWLIVGLWVQVCVLAYAAVALWYLLFLLIKTQREGGRHG